MFNFPFYQDLHTAYTTGLLLMTFTHAAVSSEVPFKFTIKIKHLSGMSIK